ncbi:MAG: rRNA pseudouridine synthase [Anaerolineaceae bacterium]|nr:rRNA pseudouridine synthase [Anaerolineaceae bacterium]
MEERVQKIISRAGYGSRRLCEELIKAGRVRINGKIASLGMKADMVKDTIHVDGTELPKSNPDRIYLALNKPRGVLSDYDPQDPRPSVLDLIPNQEHLFTVGRLDLDSEGLILLTNDGELANLLTHPRYGHEKEYRVLVARRPDQEQLATWRRGVVLEDGQKTRPAEVVVESTFGKGAWLRVVMREGRKRQIREIGTRIGLPVVRILRTRIGSLFLGNLKPREWRTLTSDEVKSLYALVSGKTNTSKRPSSKDFSPKHKKSSTNPPPAWGSKPKREHKPG